VSEIREFARCLINNLPDIDIPVTSSQLERAIDKALEDMEIEADGPDEGDYFDTF
jgi:hypothetical protein